MQHMHDEDGTVLVNNYQYSETYTPPNQSKKALILLASIFGLTAAVGLALSAVLALILKVAESTLR